MTVEPKWFIFVLAPSSSIFVQWEWTKTTNILTIAEQYFWNQMSQQRQVHCDKSVMKHHEKLNLVGFPVPQGKPLLFESLNTGSFEFWIENFCHPNIQIFFRTDGSSCWNGWIYIFLNKLPHPFKWHSYRSWTHDKQQATDV